MTLTYFMARSTLVAHPFEWGKIGMPFNGRKLTRNEQIRQKIYVYENILGLGGCLSLPWGYILYMYMTILFKQLLL